MSKSKGNNETKSITNEENLYLSCIKIHGLRILPPILDDEKRLEMQYYKQLAIQIEDKLRKRRINNVSITSVEDFHSKNNVKLNSSSISPSSSYSSDEEPTFRSQIFSESCKSDVLKMLNDNSKPAILNVPSTNNDSDIKCLERDLPNLSSKSHVESPKIDKISEKNYSSSNQGEGDSNKIDSEFNINSTPTKLIRSNSYTLDTPSPFLLALIEKNETASNESGGKKRRTWDLAKAREKWSSIEHDLNIVADKSKNCRRDCFNSLPPSSNASPEIKMFESHNFKSDFIHFPEKDEPEHSKITTKQKSIVTPVKISKKTEIILKKPSEIVLPKKPEILNEKAEIYIREVIDRINDEQNKQMIELIARQKKEQENLMKFFAEQQVIILSKLKRTYQEEKLPESVENHAITSVSEPDVLKNSETLLSECKKLLQQENLSLRSESSQTIYCTTVSSPEDTFANESLKSLTPSPEIITSSNLIVETVSSISRYSNSFSVDSLQPILNGNQERHKIRTVSSCSRQLFPNKQQMWAASKINALVRGYFVRRLIKTDRVQNLIKTIKDTLLCAMQLHHETVDNIQPADVELHRRLIQQVTAACYAFHDTFFELSKSEQLQIIALDRQRQKEKLLRPASAKSNASLSTTTQKVLERKMRRKSSDSQSRSSSSRSCNSNNEFRVRAKSLGLSDSLQNGRKTSPPNDVIRHSMNFGANKKPWR